MHGRVRELFAAALELDTAERHAFVADACGDDSALRHELESLLEADAHAGGFLDPPGARAHDDEGDPRGLVIGRYTVMRRIASGGMGTVYEAEQPQPRRRVALKLLRTPFPSAAARARFTLEAEILGRLEHHGVATIYEASTHPGAGGSVPFLAMELVADARPLTVYAREAALDHRQRLDLVRRVCDALHHAHQRGVIHRDLKPSNILVGPSGQPKLIDFGVARATEVDIRAATVRTEAGQLVGTLRYMSPEQCRGDPTQIDLRSDVYGLGVVLYELLTAALPYPLDEVAPFEIPRVIREHPPRPPSAFHRGLRGDIDAIVLTAIAKDRQRRYASAAVLGRDIERYLQGRPVEARRDHGLYTLRRTLWRHRWLVAIVVAFTAIAVSGLIAFERVRTQAALDRAEQREQAAMRETARAEQREREATREAARAERSRRQAYAYRIALAQRALDSGNLGRAKALLRDCPEDLRGWEWSRLSMLSDHSVQVLSGHRGPARVVVRSSDGRRLVTAGDDGTVRTFVRDPAALRFRPEHVLHGHTARVDAIAITPDGAQIVSADELGGIRTWDAHTGAEGLAWTGHGGSMVANVAIDPTGTIAATAGHDGTARLWDLADGRELAALTGHTANVDAIAFIDDTHLVTGSEDRSLRLWNLDTRKTTAVLGPFEEGVVAVALSPDGRELVSGGWDEAIHRWDSQTGQHLGTLTGHADGVVALAWLDAQRLASGSRDDTIAIHRVDTGQRFQLRGHDLGVEGVAATAEWVASASLDGTVRLWEPQPQRVSVDLEGHALKVHALVLTPDGRRVVSGAGPHFDRDPADNSVRLWDIRGGEPLVVATEHRAAVTALAIDHDGVLVASGDRDGVVLVRRADDLSVVHTFAELGPAVTGMAFAPRGQLVVGRSDGALQGLGAEGVATFSRSFATPVVDMAQGPSRVAFATADGAVYSTHDPSQPEPPIATIANVSALAVGPDGALAVGTTTGRLVVLDPSGGATWDTATYGRDIMDLSYCVDGSRIVTASRDYAVRLFDAQRGEMYMVIGRHYSTAAAVACSPATPVIASAGYDHTISLWSPTAAEK